MKPISIVLLVCLLLAGLVSMAAAPMASGTVTLVGAAYVPGKGVVFTFRFDGKISKSDLRGTVRVDGGGDFALDCVKTGDQTVKCTAPKAVAGNGVVVTWNGSTFRTHIQAIPEPPTRFCYAVYDWDAVPATEWVMTGKHCQETRASYGEILNWDDGGTRWPYTFLPESPDQAWCTYERQDDAYYFPYCDWPFD